MQAIFSLCGITYLLIYAFEGAIRYGLYNIGHSDVILLRDGLILLPLAALFLAQAFRLHVHPAFFVFGSIAALHGAIAVLNLHTMVPAIYGAMLLTNVLFGFLAARPLVQPSRRVLRLLALVWLIAVVGLVADKFFYTFPWMGLETNVGGIQVDVSRGWDIDSGFDKRAAGFMRSSISAAMLVPTLALIIAPRIRHGLMRFLFLGITVGAVVLTTQKGALIAIVAVSAILCTPTWSRYRLLCVACLGFAVIDVGLPLVTAGMLVPDSGGVFSSASFGMRIMATWPEAWQWIQNNQIFPFGVGLGGIGGAQRFYAANFFNPSDNFFVFLYANFGLFALVYLGWASCVGVGLPERLRPPATAALALLAFNLAYGAALSMLEDQVSALFIGAAVGFLWQLRQIARAGAWTDPFERPQTTDLRPAVIIGTRVAGIR